MKWRDLHGARQIEILDELQTISVNDRVWEEWWRWQCQYARTNPKRSQTLLDRSTAQRSENEPQINTSKIQGNPLLTYLPAKSRKWGMWGKPLPPLPQPLRDKGFWALLLLEQISTSSQHHHPFHLPFLTAHDFTNLANWQTLKFLIIFSSTAILWWIFHWFDFRGNGRYNQFGDRLNFDWIVRIFGHTRQGDWLRSWAFIVEIWVYSTETTHKPWSAKRGYQKQHGWSNVHTCHHCHH